ncbi:hypothetical protein ACN47E_000844 [Coniothyrium glycines]
MSTDSEITYTPPHTGARHLTLLYTPSRLPIISTLSPHKLHRVSPKRILINHGLASSPRTHHRYYSLKNMSASNPFISTILTLGAAMQRHKIQRHVPYIL